MTLSTAVEAGPDLLRLVAVPVFAWVALRDIRTRRVSRSVWIPLGILGAVLLVWDGWLGWNAGGAAWTEEFLLPAAVSFGFVVPLAYLFWWIGGFGGADARALLTLALLFPTAPRYAVGGVELPLAPGVIEAFSFTILTNAVLVGIAIPIALAAWNGVRGRLTPAMFLGWPVSWERLPETHGTLLETRAGHSLGGLDLDALRMYLRWRGLTLAELRESPDRYRDPASLPEEPNLPTDGAVGATPETDGGQLDEPAMAGVGLDEANATEDAWGAAAFLDDIEGSAYGTTPATLREGLEVLVSEKEEVWISPGTPFLVPVFLGLVVALLYGDVLTGLLF
ncbi:peptidase A24 [Halobacteria archaeon AArc-dxtr1]|nr:peptidase A24 [Halobacteria archaeon AArc-dxtr1]